MTLTTMRFCLAAFLAAGLLLGATSPARAISVSITSTANNTGVSLTGGGSGDRAQGNTLSVTNSGTFNPDAISAQATGSTRVVATVGADRSINTGGGTANATDNVDYTVNFSVTPDYLSSTYMVTIATNILGAATAVDDNSGLGNGGNSNMSNVTGYLNGVSNASLALASAASQGGTSSTSGAQVQFSANNSLVLGPFVGAQNFTIRFTWTMTATSPQAINGGDEAAVRIGYNDPLGGASADNYPGPGSRNIANDGHFVNITSEVLTVPEPSSVVLAGLGICGLVAVARRRRAA